VTNALKNLIVRSNPAPFRALAAPRDRAVFLSVDDSARAPNGCDGSNFGRVSSMAAIRFMPPMAIQRGSATASTDAKSVWHNMCQHGSEAGCEHL